MPEISFTREAVSGGRGEMLLPKDHRVNRKYISHQSLIIESDL